MVTRLVTLLAGALLLAGCSTEEGLRAQELLQRAESAQRALTSSTFEGSLSFAFGGERASVQLRGATSGQSEWLTMRSSGIPDGGDFAAELLLRDGRAWTNVDGSWRSLPLPADAGAGGGISAAAFQQLARHVQDVRVAEHQIVDGKPVTTIAGEIDTEGMLETVTKLGSVAGGVEGFSLDFAKLGIELGDIEAVLTIDDRTHLLDAAIVSFTMSAEGRELAFELRYRLTSANEPVELPTP